MLKSCRLIGEPSCSQTSSASLKVSSCKANEVYCRCREEGDFISESCHVFEVETLPIPVLRHARRLLYSSRELLQYRFVQETQ
jgi:hypothetical protein